MPPNQIDPDQLSDALTEWRTLRTKTTRHFDMAQFAELSDLMDALDEAHQSNPHGWLVLAADPGGTSSGPATSPEDLAAHHNGAQPPREPDDDEPTDPRANPDEHEHEDPGDPSGSTADDHTEQPSTDGDTPQT